MCKFNAPGVHLLIKSTSKYFFYNKNVTLRLKNIIIFFLSGIFGTKHIFKNYWLKGPWLTFLKNVDTPNSFLFNKASWNQRENFTKNKSICEYTFIKGKFLILPNTDPCVKLCSQIQSLLIRHTLYPHLQNEWLGTGAF